MNTSETVELTGHLIDTGQLSRILDDIGEYGGRFTIDRFDVGHAASDESHAVLTVSAADSSELARLLMRLQTHGVNLVHPGEATIREVTQHGVFPEDFYSTTNLDTTVRIGSKWIKVQQP